MAGITTRRVAMRKTARRLAGVITAAGSRYVSSGASDLAAGIAYRVLFALAPLAVALVSVFGLLLQNEELKHDVINKIVSALPVNSRNVTGAIGNIATPASAAGLVSLLVLVWAASGMMTAIRFGLERTMSVEEDRGVVHGKLVDLGLVAATVVLVFASVGVGLVTQVVSGLVAEVAGAVGLQGTAARTVVAKLLQLLLWTGTVLLLLRVVPAKRPRFADALAGAVVTALLLLVISLAAGFLYSHATKWSFIYGSLTSVFVFLYSVYLFASAVLFGAAVATEWSLPHPPDPESWLAKARRRIRARLYPHARSGSDESGGGRRT
jgi:membrane protein